MCNNNMKYSATQLVNILRENMREDFSVYEHIMELIDRQVQWDDVDAR